MCAAATTNSQQRAQLLVHGVVQGVGFRPYVYQLAHQHGLTGFVMNSTAGVVIEIEGAPAALDTFVHALTAQAPPLVEINSVARTTMPAAGDREFVIRPSDIGPVAFTLIPPDICVCDDCLRDVRDPANRRFEYPFTNCTNCGPRYSIIEDIPYDRSATTMAEFAMCDACRAEYEDPANRRFHAQPNACAVCGPHMRLVAGKRTVESADARAVLEPVAEMLRDGGIVAWKGLGGYQLACDARQPKAVEELRRRKCRSEKPFAVMVADVADAGSLCIVSAAERAALLSRERPIVLLRRRPDAALAEDVSPRNPMTGVMLPCTPMHDLLFRVLSEKMTGPVVLVMTSGNVSEEPIVIGEAEAEQQLGAIADGFAHHNRRIHTRVDDSIVRIFADEPMVMRRARGYAPQPVWLGLGEAEVLACGAQQKSTFCLTKAGFALPSQHLGDLENYETLQFFEQTLERMQRLFHVSPKVIAHDLHPNYMSTRLAMSLPAERRIGVQHHHAHIASCMAEHHLAGSVIGLAWDGTGFGTDGTIWGGEFLAAGLAGFERFGHLRNVLLAGGDAAVREPWRVARSYLRDAFGSEIPDVVAAPVSGEKLRLVDAMLDRRLNAVETSSCGRLFDAVASMIGLRHTVSFEGQAAMELEAIASEELTERYEIAMASGEVDLRPMVRQIVQDVAAGVDQPRIAARFHNTLVVVAVEMSRQMKQQFGLRRVCLSGGCFQNLRLLSGCVQSLRADGFEVFYQRKVPANDGGISLGQAAVACEIIR
ncbi:MAG: carbamoyltransferase HypF [Acidobacteriaceae bacterium]|nr:carbamoyltransferase HypF [Acidobacteriaceae bacterium]